MVKKTETVRNYEDEKGYRWQGSGDSNHKSNPWTGTKTKYRGDPQKTKVEYKKGGKVE